MEVPQGRKKPPLSVSEDEHPRPGTGVDKLAKLPAIVEGGVVTAGNASGINDGAAAMVVTTAAKAAELGVTPKLLLVGRAESGVDPSIMGSGPIPAVEKVLEKTGMEIGDLDLIELNEAFASQALYCIRELDLDLDATNVNGSGISLGHPVGATGAIMTVKIMEEQERQDKEMGLVTMCVGGGQGCATIFQRLN